ncbi:right-handed parallel beta-helix repeat-containing protein [Flavitalea flava]
MRYLNLLLVFLFLAFSGRTQSGKKNAQGHQLFVSVKGKDTNAGSLVRPFRTLEKALEYAGHFQGQQVSIQLRGGTYYLDKTIMIDAGPQRPASLQIRAWRDEQVVISAGRPLNLVWKPFRDGIYQASLPDTIEFERLYINDRLQQMARYPNYDSTARIFHGVAADAIAPERVKRWKQPAGGYLHALHEGEWGGFHYRIEGADSNGNLKLDGGWQNNRPAAMHAQFRFVENIFEELDAAGEWWLDRTKHILYYYPEKGVNLHSAKGTKGDLKPAIVVVSHLKNSIELKGTAANPVSNVEIMGLRFEHNERSFMDTKEPLLRSDWTIYRGGAVLLEGTEDCTITACDFTGLGGNAIMLSKYNKRDTISGCLVAYIGANAVCLVGDPKAVRSPSFRYENSIPYEQLDKTPGPLTNNYPEDCLVTNNLFHHLGDIEKQATGVEIAMSSHITVSNNTIYHTPRAGINIGDGCWGGHVLAYNDVFNTVLETGDHGAFNSWGRDRYWFADRKYMDSLVALHPELILLDAQRPNSIHDNRFRCDHGWDIDLDDGSTNYHIYNNICLNGGLKLREGFYRIVENNIIINNSFHPHVWFRNSGDVFAHNIVMKKYFPIQIIDWGNKIDSNLFPEAQALAEARENGTDGHSKAGDPLFKGPAIGDYTVTSNSPAFSIGFLNFPMTGFGVRDPRLRKIALEVPVPALTVEGDPSDRSAVLSFLGGTIKNVEGLGERSAFGLPDETGVIVLSAGPNSLLAQSGLLEKDVIVAADGKPVQTMKDLLAACQSANAGAKIGVTLFRNQQMVKTMLHLK